MFKLHVIKLLFTTSDYPFGIVKHFFYYHIILLERRKVENMKNINDTIRLP